ncbi:hypothetical protein [Qipengyuania sp. ASV99]|uniref:hypothetical protein n=1 Tax=Qipengyuania sp. ASV99 TaxID=3399681 RepID=UPI003A4C791A
MRFLTIAIPAAALALSACGSETSGEFTTEDGETGEYTIDQESGAASMTIDTPDGEVSMRSGADVPLDLPAGFSLISGAKVISNTVVDQADGKGTIISFTSEKAPEAIAEYYRKEAEAAGIDIQIETSINGGKMLGGEGPSGTTFSVTAYPSDDGTTGQLLIGEGVG